MQNRIEDYLEKRSSFEEPQAGFGLIESIVSILLISLFMLVGLQLAVTSTVMKTRAQRLSEAKNWVQENLERDRQRSSDLSQVSYTMSTLSTNATSGSNTLTVASAAGFQVGDALMVGNDSVNNVISTISGNTITLSSTLGTAQNPGSSVEARCRSDSMTGGFAQYLRSKLLPVLSESNNSGTPNVGTRTVGGEIHSIRRSTAVRNVNPYAVLEINYQVTDASGNTVASFDTEVVPRAYFQCS
ncbi:type II secretion system protein [Lyngbya confervoides]|uniref:Prepilin-type N-terminal cleavage/methylation domain-containing protein n=1 Tax=Lyngbya confervoides BDU141951 TaxID=1574623 RepID=A0ABD4T6L4_9CYAN|nr:type II secretion system protein [Lyngbya confervoides]MCM1984200.1 hypothetical protein [Lyngbya confervoides BDU141951]